MDEEIQSSHGQVSQSSDERVTAAHTSDASTAFTSASTSFPPPSSSSSMTVIASDDNVAVEKAKPPVSPAAADASDTAKAPASATAKAPASATVTATAIAKAPASAAAAKAPAEHPALVMLHAGGYISNIPAAQSWQALIRSCLTLPEQLR